MPIPRIALAGKSVDRALHRRVIRNRGEQDVVIARNLDKVAALCSKDFGQIGKGGIAGRFNLGAFGAGGDDVMPSIAARLSRDNPVTIDRMVSASGSIPATAVAITPA